MAYIKPIIKRYLNQIFQRDRVVKLVHPNFILLSWLWPYYYTSIVLPESATVVKAKLQTYTGRKVSCLLYDQWWIDRHGMWGWKAEYDCREQDGGLTIHGPIYGPPWGRMVSYNTLLTVTERDEASSMLSIEAYLSPGYLVGQILLAFVLFMLTWFILLSGSPEDPFRNVIGIIFPLLFYGGIQIHYRMFINEVFRFIEDFILKGK